MKCLRDMYTLSSRMLIITRMEAYEPPQEHIASDIDKVSLCRTRRASYLVRLTIDFIIIYHKAIAASSRACVDLHGFFA